MRGRALKRRWVQRAEPVCATLARVFGRIVYVPQVKRRRTGRSDVGRPDERQADLSSPFRGGICAEWLRHRK